MSDEFNMALLGITIMVIGALIAGMRTFYNDIVGENRNPLVKWITIGFLGILSASIVSLFVLAALITSAFR